MQVKEGKKEGGGIASETVDLLQGRVPRTVFARHYFTPSQDYRTKVLDALKELQKGHHVIDEVTDRLSVTSSIKTQDLS